MFSRNGLPLIYKMVRTVFPEVDDCLEKWKRQADTIPDGLLRTQALASIENKKFHCQGGCAYALYPRAPLLATLRFIVAFQTISDYLDNLCDRSGVLDEGAFRQLHLALADAVDPESLPHDYYARYPCRDDGGYLYALVAECRAEMRKLPSRQCVREHLNSLVFRYSELQSLKHIHPASREGRLRQWAGPPAAEFPGLSVWEYCAAAGSTLGVFTLFAAAQDPGFTQKEADALFSAYFPWVCALHIQLDYFIDAEEDEKEGDFNFTSYYKDTGECAQRMSILLRQSLARCSGLRYRGFHATILRGLLAMYLSDAKAGSDRNKVVTRRLLKCGGARSALVHRVCGITRRAGLL